MASTGRLEVHQTWQEAVGIGLGVLVALSPWLTGQADDPVILKATAAAGIIVLLISATELMSLHRWEEALTLLCGLWLCAGPFVLGYAGTALAGVHLVAGAAVVALSALGLWQDWRLSDDELERYGS